ncbi:MAG: cytochrome c-type biogenesis protein CcmH [Holosporales bacterium]|jgi:cytochrome c-type biogenesis protein CcmH
MRGAFLALLLSILFCQPSVAFITPQEQLSDPVLEQQAIDLGKRLRCLNCAGQDINSSGDQLAVSMRSLVRERLSNGETPEQIEAYFVQQYGNAVLFAPPYSGMHWAMWLLPMLLIFPGLFKLWVTKKMRGDNTDETRAP